MMIDVVDLRGNLKELEKKQGYVKWWAKRSELDLILKKLNVDFDDIKDALDVKEGLYCIYIGRSTNREIAGYLNMQLIGRHNKSLFSSGVSAFRKTIASIVCNNWACGEETDNFLDKLKVEISYIDYPVKSQEARDELNRIVVSFFEKNLYILNRQNNNHPLAKNIKKNLKNLRDESEKNARKYFSSIDGESSKKDNDKTVILGSIEKRNIIYFGAPGTGKSYNLNQDKDNLLENYPENFERVTFHPDYSYANFVGTYKPVPENKSITYKYVPGPFMRVLKKAIENPNEPYLLIIEEINRANVAAVFGDVFQLLDRDENNESEYDIETSQDMRRYLNKDKIKLPANLFIWATMNSADQGVFPMDTAFKRRWDFKYFSINHNENLIENIKVNINGQEIVWNELRKAINHELLTYKINEDKLMGPFFAFNEFMNKDLSAETFKDIFKNKIIMYLFEDAAKSRRNELFSGVGKNTNVTYSQICEGFDEIGIEIFTDSIKDKFIKDEDDLDDV